MDISKDQINKLVDIIGKERLAEIIPEVGIPIYDNKKIYIYGDYKLHRVNGSEYAWIDMTSSNCFANGTDTPEELFKYAGKNLMIFDSYRDYIKWANTQI